jgi:O-antigen/teichoic acid export membrane protein
VIGGGTAFGLGALWVFRGFNWPISAALGLLLCCQLWSGVAQAVLIGLERFKPLAAVNLGGTLCSLLALGLGSALWGLRGAVGGATLGFAVSGTLALSRARDVWCPVAWRQTGMPVPNRAFWQYALNAWGAALISAVVWGRTELLFLERFAGYVQAAYFGIGLAFSSLTVQLLQLFTGALMPHFAWCVGRGDSKTLNRDYRWLTVLAASIAFPVAALAVGLMPDLLPLTFGSAYSEAVPAGMWLAACGLWGFATVGSAAVYGLGDAALIRRWSVAGAVLMAVGCWGLVPLYGAAGAAVVRFGVQGIMVIAGTLILRFRYGLPFPAVQLGKLLLAATAAGMAAQMVDAAIGGGWAGVAAGLAAGGTTYLLCVRGLRAIDRGIADGLRAVASGMVGPVGRTLAAAVRLVAGGT